MLFFSKKTEDSAALGKWGQNQCEKFFKANGCKTLARNFSCKTGEIDLIMTSADGTVIFVEVKTRSAEDYADAESSITYPKKLRMTKAAKLFIKDYMLENFPLRFDIAIVLKDEKGKPQIRHYENAFAL